MTRKRVLSDDDLRKARMLHVSGWGYKRISDYFGVSKWTIRDNLKFWTAYSARVR